jgi:DNA-binding response OmpR family regulator
MEPVTVMLVPPKDDPWGAETLRSELVRAGIRLIPESEFVGAGISGAREPQIILVLLTGEQELDVEVCQQLVASRLAPVIAISAESDEANALAIFNTGVEDYLVLPIRARVLAARIRNILRRTQPALFKDLAIEDHPQTGLQTSQLPISTLEKTALDQGFLERCRARVAELGSRMRRKC